MAESGKFSATSKRPAKPSLIAPSCKCGVWFNLSNKKRKSFDTSLREQDLEHGLEPGDGSRKRLKTTQDQASIDVFKNVSMTIIRRCPGCNGTKNLDWRDRAGGTKTLCNTCGMSTFHSINSAFPKPPNKKPVQDASARLKKPEEEKQVENDTVDYPNPSASSLAKADPEERMSVSRPNIMLTSPIDCFLARFRSRTVP